MAKLIYNHYTKKEIKSFIWYNDKHISMNYDKIFKKYHGFPGPSLTPFIIADNLDKILKCSTCKDRAKAFILCID